VKQYLPNLLIKSGKKSGNISKKEKQWLSTIEAQLGRALDQNSKIHHFNVDGFDFESNTIYEFNGCFYHGCPKCYKSGEINPLTGELMEHHYFKTLRKEERLKELGYNVVSKWECDFRPNEDIEINNIIKCNNKYRMISNGKFAFKDVMAYLAPGTSLTQFLKAFDTELVKGYFPHKITQNLDAYIRAYPELVQYQSNIIQLLKNSKIPTINWFYDEFSKKNILKSEYNLIKSRYSNLYDLLKDYNNCDVQPSVEATIKLSQFFKNLGLDIHKDGISISGLTLQYLWKLKDSNILREARNYITSIKIT
jgi:G:T-mismatch repair DNA endonuclease (very short patch repair protein)